MHANLHLVSHDDMQNSIAIFGTESFISVYRSVWGSCAVAAQLPQTGPMPVSYVYRSETNTKCSRNRTKYHKTKCHFRVRSLYLKC